MALILNTHRKKKTQPVPNDSAVIMPESEGPITTPQVEQPQVGAPGFSYSLPEFTPPALATPKEPTPPYRPDDFTSDELGLNSPPPAPGTNNVSGVTDLTPQNDVTDLNTPKDLKDPTDVKDLTAPSTTAAKSPYDELYESVYGEKPGYVSTDDPDGGFFKNYASRFIDQEKLAKREKARKTRLGILALADALRNFGNIYHTTRRAPSQKFNNPVGEEYARQQKEDALMQQRIEKEIERDLKLKERQYQHGANKIKFDAEQENKRQQMEFNKERFEEQKRKAKADEERKDKEFQERERHNKKMEEQAAQRIAISASNAARRGRSSGRGGGRGGSSGGGSQKVSKYQFNIPRTITTSSGKTGNYTTARAKENLVTGLYNLFVKQGRAHAGHKTYDSKVKELATQYHNDPEVKRQLNHIGITVGVAPTSDTHVVKPKAAKPTTAKQPVATTPQAKGSAKASSQQPKAASSQAVPKQPTTPTSTTTPKQPTQPKSPTKPTPPKTYTSSKTSMKVPSQLTTKEGKKINLDSGTVLDQTYKAMSRRGWVKPGATDDNGKIDAIHDALSNEWVRNMLDDIGFEYEYQEEDAPVGYGTSKFNNPDYDLKSFWE